MLITIDTMSIFFIFMPFLEKIIHNNRFATLPLRLTPPPFGNPGSSLQGGGGLDESIF